MKYYYTLHQILTRIPLHAAPSASLVRRLQFVIRDQHQSTTTLSSTATAQLRKLRFETVAKYKIVTALMSPYNQNQKIPIQTLSDEVETIMVVAINHKHDCDYIGL